MEETELILYLEVAFQENLRVGDNPTLRYGVAIPRFLGYVQEYLDAHQPKLKIRAEIAPNSGSGTPGFYRDGAPVKEEELNEVLAPLGQGATEFAVRKIQRDFGTGVSVYSTYNYTP